MERSTRIGRTAHASVAARTASVPPWPGSPRPGWRCRPPRWSWPSRGPGPSLAGVAATVHALVIAAPIGAGLYALYSQPASAGRFGRLLVLSGFLWSPTLLAESANSVLYSAGRVSAWLAEVVLVYVVLAYPSGRLRTRADRLLVRAAALTVGVLFLPERAARRAVPGTHPVEQLRNRLSAQRVPGARVGARIRGRLRHSARAGRQRAWCSPPWPGTGPASRARQPADARGPAAGARQSRRCEWRWQLRSSWPGRRSPGLAADRDPRHGRPALHAGLLGRLRHRAAARQAGRRAGPGEARRSLREPARRRGRARCDRRRGGRPLARGGLLELGGSGRVDQHRRRACEPPVVRPRSRGHRGAGQQAGGWRFSCTTRR